MATILLRLTTYDSRVLAALEDLRRSRKQSMFVLEALRHYLESDGGREALAAMAGNSAQDRCRNKPQQDQEEKLSAGKSLSVGDIFR
ncbi:hypothetical protein [Geoalkalibacter halelectricus]|uniref:hypothetical protein n=1 Tax=Geoalkalibacter halelectricus TaxID=2847045 RepID=UPI003D1F201E